MKQSITNQYKIFNWLIPIILIISTIFVYSCSKSGTEPEKKPVPGFIAVKSVYLNKSVLELNIGDNTTLTATLTPENATNKNITWKSSNTSVVTVENGTITAKSVGNATITATTEDGGKTATCSITVKENTISVTGISLDKSSIVMKEGNKATLIATITPENATNKNVTWKSSNISVVTVENGTITAKSVGNATITATTEDGGKTATCSVTVKENTISVTGISLDKNSIEMKEGDKATLIATITPENATNKIITWKSSNSTVAIVENGVVTAKRAGGATITATTEDGNKTASCNILVMTNNIPVESVSLNHNQVEMIKGDTFKLIATVLPENASNKSIFWKSEDNSVVKFQNGIMHAVNPGATTVSVTTEDGGKTATCNVTVKENKIDITNISLDKNLLKLYTGDVITLSAIITPENATDKTLIWTSSNENVASVLNGVVTAKNKGFTNIIAKNEASGKYGDCLVEVIGKYIAIEQISLNPNAANLLIGETLALSVVFTPDNATNKNVTWSSSDTSVASIENGIVTARSIGNTTITAITEDGGKIATCDIVVSAQITSITLNKSSVEIYIGETFTLTAIVTPSNASNEKIIWSSSDKSVATVDKGVVKSFKPGKVTITATTKNGKSASCNVIVKSKVEIDDWDNSGDINKGEVS